jgi:hypothetical protein
MIVDYNLVIILLNVINELDQMYYLSYYYSNSRILD